MAFHQIPLIPDNPHFSIQIALDGATYEIECRYNTREGSWYFSLLDADGEPIEMGRKMVADWSMIYRSQHASRPPGEILVLDLSGAGLDPGEGDLDDRVILVYADEDEVAA
jgi:hypothetical protein